MLTITFENQTTMDIPQALVDEMRAYIRKTLETEGIDLDARPFELSVTCVTPETIHQLNAEYRATDRATDVLSFPMYDFPDGMAEITTPSDVPTLLGDIVLNPSRAAEQGELYGTGFEREMCYLTVHSTLHLLGYDHMVEADKRKMRAREKAVMGDE